MESKILAKLQEIDAILELHSSGNKDVSVFTGIGGIPLFYLQMYKNTGSGRDKEMVNQSVDLICEVLNTREMQISYCNGLIGIAYLFDFLSDQNVLSIEALDEINSWLPDVDDIVGKEALNNTKSMGDIDFLHGSLGAAHYLLTRSLKNTKVKSSLTILIHRLCGIFNEDISQARKLDFNIAKEGPHYINCGLAHGYVSHIMILTKFLKNFGSDAFVKQTLERCVDIVLAFESEDPSSLAQFPSIAYSKETADYNVQLGWCYGDQTLSLSLYHASKVLGNIQLEEKAKAIAFGTLSRNTVAKMFPAPGYDAGFCHGLSSVAYLHKKWHQITGSNTFHEEYVNCIQLILDFGDQKEGIFGFPKYKANGEYVNAIGLLDGSIGVGMVLSDYLLNDQRPDWENFFLLN